MIRVVGGGPPPVYEIREETLSPEELAAMHRRGEILHRNMKWFSDHGQEIYDRYVGQFVYVAGGELFAGPDVREVLARVRAAHPEESGGYFGRYIRPKNEVRVCLTIRLPDEVHV